MLHKSYRRGGLTLALLLALALSGATPASAQGFGPRSVFDWLSNLFDFKIFAADDAENSGGLSGVWEMEGAGFDPFGQPIVHGTPTNPTGGETPDEGAGFDPFGLS